MGWQSFVQQKTPPGPEAFFCCGRPKRLIVSWILVVESVVSLIEKDDSGIFRIPEIGVGEFFSHFFQTLCGEFQHFVIFAKIHAARWTSQDAGRDKTIGNAVEAEITFAGVLAAGASTRNVIGTGLADSIPGQVSHFFSEDNSSCFGIMQNGFFIILVSLALTRGGVTVAALFREKEPFQTGFRIPGPAKHLGF